MDHRSREREDRRGSPVDMWKKRFDTRANKAHRKTELRLWSLVPGRFRNVGLGRPRPTRQHEVPGESYDTPRARIREAFRKEQRRFYFPCASAISATEKETHAPLLEQKSGVESNPSKWAWRTRAAAMASEDVLECRARRWMVVHCSHAAARCARPARLESGQPLRARAGLANDIGTRLEPPPFHLPPSFSFFLRWGGREEEEGGRGGESSVFVQQGAVPERRTPQPRTHMHTHTHIYTYIYACVPWERVDTAAHEGLCACESPALLVHPSRPSFQVARARRLETSRERSQEILGFP